MEYFLVAILFLMFVTLEQLKNSIAFSKMVLWLFSLIIIFFVGLRDGRIVGTDSPAYYENYLNKYWEVEYGYRYLNLLFSSNDIHYNFFLLFINTIAIFNIVKFVNYNSKFALLSLFVYFSDFFLYYNFSGIRQALALSFTAISVNYMLQNKNIKAIFTVLIAALFHITSIVFIFCLFIPKRVISYKDFIKIAVFIGVGGIFTNLVIENIEYIALKFKFYSELQEQSENIKSSYVIGILKRSIIFVGIFLVRKSFFERENIFLFNIYVVGFIIYIATYLISPDFGVRFSTYFTLMDCVLIANVLWLSKGVFQRVCLYCLFIIVIMYKIYTYAIIDTYQYKLFV